ncbi:MAG: hypothetical protein IT368_03555 [Candidatus Hydrogenedentes bacterium]|nr:hypothetical protein [Candidatus Hydrogenedentota bacterium]
MSGTTDSLWMMMLVVTGAVGAGFLVYAFRNKDGLTLVIGAVLSALPMVTGSGLAVLALTVLILALFYVLRKMV